MTYEEKKKYLSKYKLQQVKIRRLSEMVNTCPDNADTYRDELSKSSSLRNKIELEIEAVDGDILTEVLYQKYLFGRPLEEIAFCLNYSKRQVERFHIEALNKFKLS